MTSFTPGLKSYAECSDAFITFQSLIMRGVSSRFFAFVTDFSDSFNSSWDSQQFFGKTDPIVGFKNTKRTISLGFTIPSENIAEAQNNLHQINNLAKMLYPAYSDEPSSHRTTVTKGPVIKLEWGNMITNLRGMDRNGGLMGYIDSLNISAVLDMGFFNSESGMYPKVWTLSCNFNVHHQNARSRLGRGLIV